MQSIYAGIQIISSSGHLDVLSVLPRISPKLACPNLCTKFGDIAQSCMTDYVERNAYRVRWPVPLSITPLHGQDNSIIYAW